MNSISSQITSFLASFKTFFFFVLAFIVFGSLFLFLFQSMCEGGWLCSNYLKPIFDSDFFNFSGAMGTIKFLVFAYIFGLLLYEFSRIIVKITRHILDQTHKETKNGERPNDMDIYIFLGGRDLARDIYLLQIFYSSVARLLLGTIGLAVILFSPKSWILFLLSVIIIFVFLIWINIDADRAVHSLGKQIKDVITGGEYPKKEKKD